MEYPEREPLRGAYTLRMLQRTKASELCQSEILCTLAWHPSELSLLRWYDFYYHCVCPQVQRLSRNAKKAPRVTWAIQWEQSFATPQTYVSGRQTRNNTHAILGFCRSTLTKEQEIVIDQTLLKTLPAQIPLYHLKMWALRIQYIRLRLLPMGRFSLPSSATKNVGSHHSCGTPRSRLGSVSSFCTDIQVKPIAYVKRGCRSLTIPLVYL